MRMFLGVLCSLFLVSSACAQNRAALEETWCALKISASPTYSPINNTATEIYSIANFISRSVVSETNSDVIMFDANIDEFYVVVSRRCSELSQTQISSLLSRLSNDMYPLLSDFSAELVFIEEYGNYISAISAENDDIVACSMNFFHESGLSGTLLELEMRREDAALLWEISLSGGFKPLAIEPNLDGIYVSVYGECDPDRILALKEILTNLSGRAYTVDIQP